MSSKTASYAWDHSANTLATHEARSVQNESPYLLPYLKPGMKILDVGCGPGTITVSVAKLVGDGQVTGLETNPNIVDRANAIAEREKVSNVKFAIGDATALPFADNTFDLAYTHQVLLHISKPVECLCEMRRVVKPGGLVCAREGEMEGWIFYPESPKLLDWCAMVAEVIKSSGGLKATGRNLHVYAREAGFKSEHIKRGASAWLYTKPEERKLNGYAWGKRSVESNMASQALKLGIRSREELEGYKEAWKQWADCEDGWLTATSGEIVCCKE